MELQSPSLSSVVFEQKLTHADKSVLFGAVVATNLEHAILLEKQLGQLTNTVADVEPPPDMLENFIEANQIKKLPLVRAIKQEVQPLQFAMPDRQPVDIYALSRTLYYLYGYCGAALDEIGNSDPELAKQFVSLRQAIGDLRKAMLAGDASVLAGHADKLAEFQQALFDDGPRNLPVIAAAECQRAAARGRFAPRLERPIHR